ncbi:hypothetical protein LK996_12215 [Lysobacter sp. A6]|uniref:Uncharacterized protein n=1 Tax=Noviluteimonas lactosilytica TaxID=2888523 RepID=A0ABS8JK65_9GAMM|nr:hypothetical protein [Lysobacter lactosilyticus]MCC8363838.1 hypothetical protein [Lysobacter lactosilyticus]
MPFSQFRSRDFWKRIGLVAGVLVLAQIAFHAYLLHSGPYEAAISDYIRAHPSEAHSTYALCSLCPKRISYGAGTWIYRFSLDVDSMGKRKRYVATVKVTSGEPPYEVELVPKEQ